MYLPIMRKVDPIQVSYLAPSTIEVLLGNVMFVSVFAVSLLSIGIIFSGLTVLASAVWIIFSAIVVFGLNFGPVYASRSRQYSEAMLECGRKYRLKSGTYFGAICDMTRSWVSIMLAFNIEDPTESDQAHTSYCLAEYRMLDRDFANRECDAYLLKQVDGKVVEQEFTTKYGFEIKVFGLTEDNELEFEIIGLKKLGRTFR